MAEQRKSRSITVGEALARKGRAALHSPFLVRTAEKLMRFLLGAVLAGGEIFGGYAPFGIGVVACSGSGMDGLWALLGASLGYLFLRGLTAGLRYAAACVLVFSVAFAFYDVRLYQKSWFMPTTAAVMDAVTGFIYLSDSNWDVAQTAFFITEVVLAGGSAYFFRIALSPWETGERELSARQTVSLFFLAGSLLSALAGLTIFGDISLGRGLGVLLVMAAAHAGGLSRGAAAGVAVGVGMDLVSGGGGFYTMAYGFAGLLTGAAWRQGRLFGAITYVVANAVAVAWSWGGEPRVGALYEAFLASVCFLLLPQRHLNKLGAMLRREEGDRAAQRCAAYAARRLEDTARAFRQVRDSLRSAFPQDRQNDADPARIFDRAAQRVCAGCPLRGTCWGKDSISTYNALNDALSAMLEKGKGEAGDYPGWFASRCVRFPAFLGTANEELTALRYRQQYQSRLKESRGAVCRQYETLSQILSSASSELAAELTPDLHRDRKLRGYLAGLGVEGETAVYYDQAGHLRLELEGDEVDQLETEEHRSALSQLMGLPLRREEEAPGRVTFTQAEPFMAVAGLAARRREGQRESGDTGTWFRRGDGSLFVLLCDGVGSGEWAHRESALAVRLLEEFLRSGMEASAALRTVNSALALRNEETGAFTTVDLLRLDLFTGQGELCKLGAASTYVCRGEEVRRVSGSALPAGLADGAVSPDVTPLELKPGDWVLLVSDGVADPEEDGWLRELLEKSGEEKPKDLARLVMEESEKRVGAADDRTAVVVRLKNREGL